LLLLEVLRRFFFPAEYLWDDPTTNSGLVTSATINSFYENNTSIKIVVYPSESVGGSNAQPVNFTCDGEFKTILLISEVKIA